MVACIELEILLRRAHKIKFLKKTRISGIPEFFSKFFFSIFFHIMATVGLALFERPPPIQKRLRQSCRAHRAEYF